MPTLLLIVLAAALLACCWWDLKTRTIPNWLNLAIALLAIPFWSATGLPLWPDMALQIGIAFVAFWVFAAAFAMGAMGGGDVKLIAALALWLPWTGGAGAALPDVGRGRRADPRLADPPQARRSARTSSKFPTGWPSHSAGLWLISERFLNQFG